MKINLFTLLFSLLSLGSLAQTIPGRVVAKSENGEYKPIVGAIVRYGSTATSTNQDGHFSIKINGTDSIVLVTFAFGFNTDTSSYPSTQKAILVVLSPKSNQTQTVNIENRNSIVVGTLDAKSTQLITTQELAKAACCNLSESFETNASVDVSMSDAVTGARRIKMLGLDGKYVQLLNENVSEIRGLGGAYGIQYIPGHWMESIQIQKGPGSVINGYESFTGQMNVEMLKPETSDRFGLSAYQNIQGRSELTGHITSKPTSKFQNSLLFHTQQEYIRWDMNQDGFMDQPLVQNYQVFDRWHYRTKRLEMQVGLKAMNEDRTSGTIADGYRIRVQTQRYNAFAKVGILFPRQPYKSIGNILSIGYHNHHMQYGSVHYNGDEQSLQYTFIYQTIWKETKHKWKFGGNLLYDNFNEKYKDTTFLRKEVVPGVYSEYTFTPNERFNLIAGGRADFHNLYGIFLTPRLNAKYNIGKKTIFKVSAGTAFRTPNLIAENIGLLASNRMWYFESPLKPEKSRILGLSFIQMFKLNDLEWTLTADVFRTDFTQQMVVDIETFGAVKIYLLNGISRATSAQLELNGELVKGWSLRLAYRYDDPRTTYSGVTKLRPLVEQHKILINSGYETRNKKWVFDATAYRVSPKRIPDNNNLLHQVSNGYSPAFVIVNAQITRKLKRGEVYIGGENLLNVMLHKPLTTSDYNSPNFDASLVWGPIMGRNIYAGLRYKIKQKKS